MTKDPTRVDLLSTIAFIVQTRYEETFLSHATGFIMGLEDVTLIILVKMKKAERLH